MTATVATTRTLFGWQGLSVTVPACWEPTVLDGDWNDGYARLADMDAVRMELKWNRLKGNVDSESVREALLEKLRRRYRAADAPVAAETLPSPISAPNASFFRWRGETAAVGAVVWCQRCMRALLGQVIFPGGKERRGEAVGILDTLRDHGDGGRALWSLYLFRAEVADTWKLTSWNMTPGYLEMAFDRGAGERLRLRRWGPAETLLARLDFATWHERSVVPQSGRSLRTTDDAVDGHPAIRLDRDASDRTLGRWVPRLAPLRSVWTHWNLTGLAWHCRRSNRLYAWDYAWRKTRAECDWRIRCHGGDATS